MIVEQYLQSKVLTNYKFSDESIQAAMLPIKRYDKIGIDAGADVREVEPRELDLAEAELWDMASGLLNGGGSRKALGNRSFTDMSIQTAQNDRQEYRNMAKQLRSRWGIKVTDRFFGVSDCSGMWGGKR